MTRFIDEPRQEGQPVPCLEDTGSSALQQECTCSWHSSPSSSSTRVFTVSLHAQAQTPQVE